MPFEERKRVALEDLAIYRSVSFRDLSDARFGGNDFAARRGISQMHEAGLSSGARVGVRGQALSDPGADRVRVRPRPARAATRRRWTGW